jgi:diacylglycerol kinase family enzyme
VGLNAADLSELKVGAVINTSSGGCDAESEEKMLRILKNAGIVEPKIWCGDANKMEQSFEEAIAKELAMLIVLGGDGTIRKAAETCGKTGCYLIPLPGGTMNMLPRALYHDSPWEKLLENILAAPSIKSLSAGRIGDTQFFVAAVFGAPSLWVEPRESIREGDFLAAIEKGRVAFKKMFETNVQYFISAQMKGNAEAVAVICPLISQEMSASEQALEAAVIDVEGASEVIRLVTAAAFGKWRKDKNVLLTKTSRLTVHSSNDIPAILDGERLDLGKTAETNFVAKAVNVLVPANNQVRQSRTKSPTAI